MFVEVGAHDGQSWSNTWGLSRLGWKGLYFEPMPDLAAKCRANHAFNPRVKVIEAAVTNYDGSVRLYINGNPTIDLETVDKAPWGEEYDKAVYVDVPCVTLNSALAKEMWPPFFDLLVIDVEGAELQVLQGIDLIKWTPMMVILETHTGNSDVRRQIHSKVLESYMSGQPYVCIQRDGLNSIYVLTGRGAR